MLQPSTGHAGFIEQHRVARHARCGSLSSKGLGGRETSRRGGARCRCSGTETGVPTGTTSTCGSKTLAFCCISACAGRAGAAQLARPSMNTPRRPAAGPCGSCTVTCTVAARGTAPAPSAISVAARRRRTGAEAGMPGHGPGSKAVQAGPQGAQLGRRHRARRGGPQLPQGNRSRHGHRVPRRRRRRRNTDNCFEPDGWHCGHCGTVPLRTSDLEGVVAVAAGVFVDGHVLFSRPSVCVPFYRGRAMVNGGVHRFDQDRRFARSAAMRSKPASTPLERRRQPERRLPCWRWPSRPARGLPRSLTRRRDGCTTCGRACPTRTAASMSERLRGPHADRRPRDVAPGRRDPDRAAGGDGPRRTYAGRGRVRPAPEIPQACIVAPGLVLPCSTCACIPDRARGQHGRCPGHQLGSPARRPRRRLLHAARRYLPPAVFVLHGPVG